MVTGNESIQQEGKKETKKKATQYTLTSSLTLGTPINVSSLLIFSCIVYKIDLS